MNRPRQMQHADSLDDYLGLQEPYRLRSGRRAKLERGERAPFDGYDDDLDEEYAPEPRNRLRELMQYARPEASNRLGELMRNARPEAPSLDDFRENNYPERPQAPEMPARPEAPEMPERPQAPEMPERPMMPARPMNPLDYYLLTLGYQR